MLRNHRVWLYAAGGWLLLAGLLHLGVHVSTFVLEDGMVGQRAFAMNAMKQALAHEPLRPSLWGLLRVYSVSYALLMVFAGSVDVLLAWTDAPVRAVRPLALFGTVFWTVAFVPYAFLDPVLAPLVAAAVAVPLHGLAWLTVSHAEGAPPG